MLVLSILANVTFIFAFVIKNTTRNDALGVTRKNALFSDQLIWNKGNEKRANQEECLSMKLKPRDFFFSFASIIKQRFNFRG